MVTQPGLSVPCHSVLRSASQQSQSPRPPPPRWGGVLLCPAQSGSTRFCSAPGPGFSAQPVSQASLYSSRSVQRSSQSAGPVALIFCLVHRITKLGWGRRRCRMCISIGLFCLNELELNKMQNPKKLQNSQYYLQSCQSY